VQAACGNQDQRWIDVESALQALSEHLQKLILHLIRKFLPLGWACMYPPRSGNTQGSPYPLMPPWAALPTISLKVSN